MFSNIIEIVEPCLWPLIRYVYSKSVTCNAEETTMNLCSKIRAKSVRSICIIKQISSVKYVFEGLRIRSCLPCSAVQKIIKHCISINRGQVCQTLKKLAPQCTKIRLLYYIITERV